MPYSQVHVHGKGKQLRSGLHWGQTQIIYPFDGPKDITPEFLLRLAKDGTMDSPVRGNRGGSTATTEFQNVDDSARCLATLHMQLLYLGTVVAQLVCAPEKETFCSSSM